MPLSTAQEPTPTPGGLVIGPTPSPTAVPSPSPTPRPQNDFAHPYFGWSLTLPEGYEITASNPDNFIVDGVQFKTVTPDQIGWLDNAPSFTDASGCLTASESEILSDAGGRPIRQRDPHDSWELYISSESETIHYIRCVVLYADVALLQITAASNSPEVYNEELAPFLQLVSDNLVVPDPGSDFSPPSSSRFASGDRVRYVPEDGTSICLLYFEPQLNASWSSPDDSCALPYEVSGGATWTNGIFWWHLEYAEGPSVGRSAGYAPEYLLEPWPSSESVVASEGTSLYSADTQSGLAGWSGSPNWIGEDGNLTYTGNQRVFEYLLAPYSVTSSDDYAVEAEMRWTGGLTCGAFGLSTRGEAGGAYHMMVTWLGDDCTYDFMNSTTVGSGSRVTLAAMDPAGRPHDYDSGCFESYLERACPEYLDHGAFAPGDEWHTYRLEVEGTEIRVFIDGELVLYAIDSRFAEGGEVGLWSAGAQFAVRRFAVYELP